MTFAAEVKWTWDSGAAVLEERAVAVEGRLSVEAEMPEVGVAHLKGMCAYKHEEGHVENKQISIWRNGFCYEERLLRLLLCKKDKGNPISNSGVSGVFVHFSTSSKKPCCSPQRKSFQCAVLFHVTNTSYSHQVLPALRKKSHWNTSSKGNES